MKKHFYGSSKKFSHYRIIIKPSNLIKHLNRNVQAPKFTLPLNQQGHENETGCNESIAVKYIKYKEA